MRHPAKKFALGTLAVNVIWLLFEHMMGYNTIHHDIGEYTRMFPEFFFSFMLIAAIYYQRKRQSNVISYAKGFRTGVVMTLIYCPVYTIVLILYEQLLNPQYFQTLKDFTMGQLQAKNASAQEIETVIDRMQMISGGTAFSYLIYFALCAVWGVAFSALVAFILKKEVKSV
jgi:hypothetical protein